MIVVSNIGILFLLVLGVLKSSVPKNLFHEAKYPRFFQPIKYNISDNGY